MKDYVVAIYRRENYAGDTIWKLSKVVCNNEPIPEKYNSCEYKFKLMQLEEFSIEG